MVTSVIVVILFLAGFALVWWGIGRLEIPEPVKTVVLVILGLLCILAIYHFIVAGGLSKLTL
jgi:hypothetical protein